MDLGSATCVDKNNIKSESRIFTNATYALDICSTWPDCFFIYLQLDGKILVEEIFAKCQEKSIWSVLLSLYLTKKLYKRKNKLSWDVKSVVGCKSLTELAAPVVMPNFFNF